jgi:hypothetical protein
LANEGMLGSNKEIGGVNKGMQRANEWKRKTNE